MRGCHHFLLQRPPSSHRRPASSSQRRSEVSALAVRGVQRSTVSPAYQRRLSDARRPAEAPPPRRAAAPALSREAIELFSGRVGGEIMTRQPRITAAPPPPLMRMCRAPPPPCKNRPPPPLPRRLRSVAGRGAKSAPSRVFV